MITVKAVDGGEELSAQEREAKLLAEKEAVDAAAAAASAAAEGEKGGDPPAPAEWNNENVLSYIRDNFEGVEAEDLGTLLSKPEPVEAEVPEELKPYLNYKKETGRGLQDYMKLNESFDSVSADQRLRQYYEAQNPGLDADDIDFLMNKKFGVTEDADDDAIREASIAKKSELAKANEHFDGLKEKYKAPAVSAEGGTPGEAQKKLEAIQAQLASDQEASDSRFKFFQEKTAELFNDSFEGFDFTVGEEKMVFKSGESGAIAKAQSDIGDFIKKYLDPKTGLIADPAGYHKALHAALNPDKLAEHFYNKGKADYVKAQSAADGNHKPQVRKVPGQMGSGSVTIKSVSPASSSGLKMK